MSFLAPKPAPIIINQGDMSGKSDVPSDPGAAAPLGAEPMSPGPRASSRKRQPSFLGEGATANRTGAPTFSGSPGTAPNFGSKTLLGQ